MDELIIKKDIYGYGIIRRKKGDKFTYSPWPHEWQEMTEQDRVKNGIYVTCLGQGEFEVLKLGEDLENVSCETLELSIHRQFFDQWERLHAFKGARELQMECAQQLVETAQIIRNLRTENGEKK